MIATLFAALLYGIMVCASLGVCFGLIIDLLLRNHLGWGIATYLLSFMAFYVMGRLGICNIIQRGCRWL